MSVQVLQEADTKRELEVQDSYWGSMLLKGNGKRNRSGWEESLDPSAALDTVSLWLLLCLWMWGIFFGEFHCLPARDCSAVSCDSGALARGSERTSFYSAILNQSQYNS